MRTFLALTIPGDVVAYLKTVIARLDRRTEGVRWVRDEGIHITVKFLGEIDEAVIPSMREALKPVGRLAPIAASLGELDGFPSKRSTRVIVVRLKKGADEAGAVWSEVEEALSFLHIEPEKRGFTPHITLGRRRAPKALVDGDPPPVEERPFLIDSLVLFKSTLTPGGAIYDPIFEIRLGGEDR